jgi:cyanophycinase
MSRQAQAEQQNAARTAGALLLEGGAEFGGQMALADQAALARAGGPGAPTGILPTAAAPDNNHARAGSNGLRWFRSLGARQVSVIPLIDAASANDPLVAQALHSLRLIYLLGGFPRYLVETLRGSLAWQAVLQAYQQGALIAGSSAGAMALCEFLFDPADQRILPGLGLLANACVLPHHNTFGQAWAPRLSTLLPGATLIGIDEQTGMLDGASGGGWQVYGAGVVTLYHEGRTRRFPHGAVFDLP